MQIPGVGEVPLKVKFNGVEFDLTPLVGKLMSNDGIKLNDLLPFAFMYAMAQFNKPQAPTSPYPVVLPQPAPAPVPEPAPAPKPPVAIPAGEPLAKLSVAPMWRQVDGVNKPADLNILGWGNKVAFDCNGFDAAGNKRADLAHSAIQWFWKWDADKASAVIGYAVGVDFEEKQMDSKPAGAISAGSSVYFQGDGATVELKIHQEEADKLRHKVEFWCEADSAIGRIKSNVLVGYVN